MNAPRQSGTIEGVKLGTIAQPHWADRVRTEVNAVDVVFDGVGGEIGREAFTLLSPSGRFSPYGRATPINAAWR